MSKKIVILGAGESGTGAAILAKKQGYVVFLSDYGTIKEKYKEELAHHQIPYEEQKHSLDKIYDCEEVIKSPGIPDDIPVIKKYHEKNIPVISEIEFAARYTNAHLIGITGTNGKTTTTLLTYHIFKKAGINVGLGGNVGESFARQVALHNFTHYVLELSSFQLDAMFKTRINTAILLNITPDHLDRYAYKIENYITSKFRITQNQTKEDAFIYCHDDSLTINNLNHIKGTPTLYQFSIKEKIEEGAYQEEKKLIITHKTQPFIMKIEELALQGKHNLYNSMAAGIASKIGDIRKESLRESLSDFENIEHRLEFVTRVHGIDFINDSKATNVNSTWYALESMTKPIVWIVGGVDKGNDFESLRDLVKEKVKAIVCLGIDNKKIHKAFGDIIPTIVDTTSAEQAVKTAYKLGKQDDVVLLSPACASFDLFQNYEDRGWQYKQAVRSL